MILSELLFIKLGGSLITDKREQSSAREDVIGRLAGEVRLALDERSDLRLLVGHGSGSFGHFAAQQFNFSYEKQNEWQGFVEIGRAAARLNQIVLDGFLAEGVPVFPIQPSASARSKVGELINMDSLTVGRLIEQGQVPLIYGDVCLDDAYGWTIISTEQILIHLSADLKPQRVILAGEVAGVYTANPSEDVQANLIEEITEANFDQVRRGLTGADGYDVTGGMLDKVEKMLALVQAHVGLEVQVISGLEPGHVQAALVGEGLASSTVIR